MLEWFAYWWDRCINYHHVNPVIFLALYIPKTFIYYWTIFHIIRALRRKQLQKIPGLVVLNVTTNVAPWVYVYLFGANLPWWFGLWFLGVFVFTFVYLGRTVGKRMTEEREENIEPEEPVRGSALLLEATET